MGLKVRKKRMKDQFKDNINADNNESKVKKKNLGRLYICSGGANLHSQGKVMLGLNEIDSTPKARYKKTFLVQLSIQKV